MRDSPPAPRLLVIEDDRALGGMLEEILETAGFDVELCRDGRSGLHLGLTRTYDVMVLDRDLTETDGLDILERLRTRGALVPVLLLSAFGQSHDCVEGFEAGADDYLAMPFNIDELLARIGALLRR